jgi:hypothetical protein
MPSAQFRKRLPACRRSGGNHLRPGYRRWRRDGYGARRRPHRRAVHLPRRRRAQRTDAFPQRFDADAHTTYEEADAMKLTIIGAGNMGRGIGTRAS